MVSNIQYIYIKRTTFKNFDKEIIPLILNEWYQKKIMRVIYSKYDNF